MEKKQRIKRPRIVIVDAYTDDKCEHCDQDMTWGCRVNAGMVDILKALAVRIKNKGINVVHPYKEMLVSPQEFSRKRLFTEGVLTAKMINNLGHLHAHGLVHPHSEHERNWIITRKGFGFLSGGEIPLVVKITKGTGNTDHNYWMPDKYRVTIGYFKDHDDEGYWQGINYEVIEGQVVIKKVAENGQIPMI